MRSLGRGASLLLLLLALASPARATVSPIAPASRGGFRQAWLYVDPRGAERLGVALMTPADALDSVATMQALAAMLGGPLAHAQRTGSRVLDVTTGEVAIGRTPDGRARFALDPEPVLGLLRAASVRGLSITFVYPRHTPLAIDGGDALAWDRVEHGGDVVQLATARAYPVAHVVAGWSPLDRAMAGATAALLLLLPWLGGAWVIARVRRDVARRAPGAWFRGMQWLTWLMTASLLGILVVAIDSPLGHMVQGAADARFAPVSALAAMVLALAATASSLVALTLAQHAITLAGRGQSIPLAERFTQAGWSFVLIAAVGLGLIGTFTALHAGQPLVAITTLVAAVALALLARVRTARALGMEPHALSHGELRDRLVALAERAGVTLRQLYVVPMRRSQMANAFAVRRDVVVLTDWLLEHLERREVDAVLAHELAHLKLGHTRKLAPWSIAGAALCGVCVGEHMVAWMIPLAVLGSTLATRFASRRYEREADAEAVRLCGDPEALIRGLVRLARLNDVPIEWSVAEERTLTHPSTERRARTIGAAAGLTTAQVDALLADATPPRDGYGAPVEAQPGHKLFSTPWKHAASTRIGVLMLVVASVAPALVLLLAARLHAPRAFALPAAAAVAFVAVVVASDLLAARGVCELRRAFARRRAPRDGARYVGIAPGPDTRVHEGFADWDVGFLTLERDALVYEGEEATVRLPRAAIASVRVQPGVPGWIATPRVAIAWTDAAHAREGVLLVRPADVATLHALAPATARLAHELAAWRAEAPAFAAEAPAAFPPRAEDVTGTSPRAVAATATLALPVLLALILSALACTLLGLPSWPWEGAGWLDAWAAAAIALVLMRVPLWRNRAGETEAPRKAMARAA